jgi:hypothetical protein
MWAFVQLSGTNSIAEVRLADRDLTASTSGRTVEYAPLRTSVVCAHTFAARHRGAERIASGAAFRGFWVG